MAVSLPFLESLELGVAMAERQNLQAEAEAFAGNVNWQKLCGTPDRKQAQIGAHAGKVADKKSFLADLYRLILETWAALRRRRGRSVYSDAKQFPCKPGQAASLPRRFSRGLT